MKKLLLAAVLLLATPALAQNVQQSGSVTRNHIPVWVTSGVIGDGGSSADSPISSIGVTNNGGSGICVNSARQTAAGYNALCLGASTAGPATISLQNFGTAAAQSLQFVINGAAQGFPTVSPLPVTIGDIPCFSTTAGALKDCGSTTVRSPNPGNLYVTATGNDSNACISLAAPCLTLQRAINTALSNYDFQGNNLIINVGAGTFAGGVVAGPNPGAGGSASLVILGAGPNSTIFNSTIIANDYANVQIGSMKIAVASGSDVLVENYSFMSLHDGSVNFGSAVTALVDAVNTATFQGQSNFGFTISGGAQFGFLVSTQSSVQLSVNATYTITGTPNFSIAFVDAIDNSVFNPGTGSTWSGTATGTSYSLAINSSIDTEQSAQLLPGTGYGTAYYSSAYYGAPYLTNNSFFDGVGAGASFTTGLRDTGVGIGALNSLSAGNDSTVFGYAAAQTSTVQNDAFGSEAGSHITTSLNNLAIGAFSLGGSASTALTGSGNNTAVGFAAMQNTSGTANTNTSVGATSLSALVSGASNTAIGYASGFSTTGAGNSLLGTDAGQFLSSGSNNTAVGFNAFAATVGAPITGSFNIGLGFAVALSGAADTNEIVIGKSITGLGSNSIDIGGVLTATGINTPATSAVNLPGSLSIGTQQTTQGTVVLDNTAAGAFALTLQSSNSASAAWTLTFPTAAPVTSGSVFVSTTGGVASWAAPGQLPGSATNDSASAGNVGEYVSSAIASGSAVNVASSGTPVNLTSTSLTAGDWDVDVTCNFSGGSTTVVTTLACGLSTTSATFDNTLGRDTTIYVSGGTAALYNSISAGFPPPTVSVSHKRFSLSGTTTIYGVAGSQFATSTTAVYGILSARRPR